MSGLGIVAALAVESRPLGPAIQRGDALVALANDTLLVVSGMGPAAAGQGARRLVDAGARALLSWGMAGGLDPALAAGTVVLPSEVVSADGESFPTAREWRERLCRSIASSHPVCGGRLLTRREPIGSASDKASAFVRTAAAAVDMESAAVAEVAASHGLPFLAVRAIVDTAADDLPSELIAAAAGAEGVRLGRLLGSLVRTPADLPRVIRLIRRYLAARRALATVARSVALVPHDARADRADKS